MDKSHTDIEINFDDVPFEDFEAARSDHFRIAFAAHMVHLGDEGRAYARALADCGVIPPSPESLKKLGKELLGNNQIQGKMREMRTKLLDSYVDRLQEHLDELADLRDLAKTEGKYAPAVAAEVARGRVQGFYDAKAGGGDPEEARALGEDDLKKRVQEALGRMNQRSLTTGQEVAEFAMREASRDY